MKRQDGRAADEIRSVRFTPGFLPYSEGSVLIELGDTRVICAVSVEETAPPFLRGSGVGWLTAEYRMLPRATLTRKPRETAGHLDGRSTEIQRLIGRSLRAAVDRSQLGERTLIVDCDVLTADGGTRTAAISGGYVAVALACVRLHQNGLLGEKPLQRQLGAISAGLVGGMAMLDLAYAEDSIADVDCNAVMTDRGEIVEYQISSERALPSNEQVEQIACLVRQGIRQILDQQKMALDAAAPGWTQLLGPDGG